MKRIRFLNGEFDPVTEAEVVESALELIEKGERGNHCTVNVGSLMAMRRNPRLARFYRDSTFVTVDGQPMLWAARLLGIPLHHRVTGTDTMDALNHRAQEEGHGIYLLGGTAESVAGTARFVRDRFPGLEICGYADGYFDEAEAFVRAQAIADSGARILYVGMGVPRQEYFLEKHWDQLGVNFAIGVGGSFEVLSGAKMRAPVFVQRMGLEWAFRLAQEPRRLWKRYLLGNSEFLFLLALEMLGFPRVGRSSPAR